MLEGLTPPKKVHSCGVARTRDGLAEADRSIFDDALLSEEWSTLGLSKALAERGLGMSYAVLYRHRNRNCSCFVNFDKKLPNA